MKKNAFTLAEVLITLGIIGVVAAMTLPSLVQHYKKQQTITALKKSYTIFNQAMKLSEVDNGEITSWTIPAGSNPSLAYIEKYFLPYFKKSVICDTPQKCGYNSNEPFHDLNGDVSPTTFTYADYRTPFLTADGILYSVSVSGGGDSSKAVIIDINGPKKPNQFGVDVFTFIRNEKGLLPNDHEKTDDEVKSRCATTPSNNYWGCTALIVRNGWEIPDDYPAKF